MIYLLYGYFLLALFNPLFKKYDYGAGFPLIIILAILGLVLVVMEFKKKREKAPVESVALAVFAFMVGLSFYFSEVRNFGFSEALAFGSVAVLYLALAHRKQGWIERFLDFVMLSALAAALLGFVFYLTRGELRMFGPFMNTLSHANVWPNAFALFLLLAWPTFLRNWNWLRAVGLGIVLAALVLTFSRGALIAFAGQLVLLGIYFARSLSRRGLVAAVLCIVVAVALYFGGNYFRSLSQDLIDVQERISFANDEGMTSKQERIDFWEGAIDLADDRPLVGYGPYSFRYAYNPIQETFLANADHPHNVFLKIAAENGLVALAAFVVFLLAVLLTVARRFGGLDKNDRDVVYLMGVAVLGAFAHNLIDYNLNFAANIFLLFLYLAMMRSMVVGSMIRSKQIFAPVLGIFLAALAVFEGGILFLSKVSNESYLQYSLFPRSYYLNEAQAAIDAKNYQKAELFLEEETDLNQLDAQAEYLKGVLCKNENGNAEECFYYFKKAFDLNPMNEFNYYSEYLEYLAKVEPEKVPAFVEESTKLVESYFEYVDHNVHFTAYTGNVEAAARFITNLIRYIDDGDKKRELIYKMSKMMERAEELRMAKSF